MHIARITPSMPPWLDMPPWLIASSPQYGRFEVKSMNSRGS